MTHEAAPERTFLVLPWTVIGAAGAANGYTPPFMTTLVVAEKPSVARDIAEVIGAKSRGEGCLRGNDHVVTWAIGHLVGLAEPHQINAAWKKWRLSDLPLMPQQWPLVIGDSTRAQFEVVRHWMAMREVKTIVCATDAGREGELIFRYIYEAASCNKPVQRLWISSLTPQAITDGLANLRAASAFDALADAARARSRADWLVGMNLSRAYSVLHDDNLSVGRVQTPTLAMMVTRERAIRDFVPEDYLEVVAEFGLSPRQPESQGQNARPPDERQSYMGSYVRPGVPERDGKRLPSDGKEASAIVERAKRGLARIASVTREQRRAPPPLLYDLTELQRHANRLYGFTAQRTLELSQNLYERRKLLSYPRTDSRHLGRDDAATLGGIVEAVAPQYDGLVAPGSGARPLGPRFVDDAQVSDHHAIIPTTTRPSASLPTDEHKIYDLVCRRLLAAWHGDHVFAVTSVATTVHWNGHDDRYVSSGTSIEEVGWKVLEVRAPAVPLKRSGDSRGVGDTDTSLPGGLTVGAPRRVVDCKAVPHQTKPPPRFTDGTLLTAMENAGRAIEQKEIANAMRECGLGTPATRASILETLLRRAYVTRVGKALEVTDKGLALIDMVHPHVKSPAMTGEWEAKLAGIERGEVKLAAFMSDIERYVREVVGSVTGAPPAAAPAPKIGGASQVRVMHGQQPAITEAQVATLRSPASRASTPPPAARPPRSRDLDVLLREPFGFASFRPYQEEVCRSVALGHDVLLVMPTGAGKSLCYQLPGLARGGTTLVVSPLIALMEDQVMQLRARGISAERIHSGRDRAESRAVCQAYLAGELEFLFIAPERLKVAGFPEMLARRKPSLIAIDEAHCISQWGHDFRPDYRMLGERLPQLRPAPVMALTATATPTVQSDIVNELRLDRPSRFIHGFRRSNIAVEVVERPPAQRADVVQRLLADPAHRPAIVYAPTRKEAEQLALGLQSSIRAGVYHAGMRPSARDEAQTLFLTGKLDVIVATTAFGMGIDKSNVRTVLHTALPSSVEGYYQEIGRAGRDGAPSRAVLLHSFADTKTHEFFFARDYPDARHLQRLHESIPRLGISSAELPSRARLPAEVYEKALEKLWVHGGVIVDGEDVVHPGRADWPPAYEKQCLHKREQLAHMRRYAETPACRMLQLVQHFGDQNDAGQRCGQCDVCAPRACVVQTFRAAQPSERVAAERVFEALNKTDGRTVGQLHGDLFAGEAMDRSGLAAVLEALARDGLISLTTGTFVKAGSTISYQRVHLTAKAKAASALDTAVLLIAEIPPAARSTPGKRGKKRKPSTSGKLRGSATQTSARNPRPRGRAAASTSQAPSGASSALEQALRLWRKQEAARRRVPAFRVLTDRTLHGLVSARPSDEATLLEVPGVGPGVLAKFGTALLALVRASRDAGPVVVATMRTDAP